MSVAVACGQRVNRLHWGVADAKRLWKPRDWETTPSGGGAGSYKPEGKRQQPSGAFVARGEVANL